VLGPSGTQRLRVSRRRGGFRPGSVPIPGDAPLALGDHHTCWLEASDTVRCVGWNVLGQVGAPDTDGQIRTPHTVDFGAQAAPLEFTQIAARGAATCVLTVGGEPLCWGRNLDGQAHEGGVQNGTGSPTPRPLPGLTAGDTVLQVAMSGYSACVRLPDSVRCLGNGSEGALGHGGFEDQDTLTPVAGLGRVESLWPVLHLVCALSNEGTKLQCWGQNLWGQAAGLPGSSHAPEPADLSHWFDTPLVAVHAGWRSTCALDAANRLRCWGLNEDGQLGVKGPGLVLEPLDGAVASPLRTAWAGSHGCAATEEGIVAWGANEAGQVGTGFVGPSVIPSPTPLTFAP